MEPQHEETSAHIAGVDSEHEACRVVNVADKRNKHIDDKATTGGIFCSENEACRSGTAT